MTKRKLALIVHGIGEQKPGETLDQLVGAASGENCGSVDSDIKWMRDQHDKTNPRSVDLFPCHTRTVTANGTEIVFAEVFWADLSTGARNWIFVLIELVKIILGLGYVVRENINEQYPKNLYDPRMRKQVPPSRFGVSLRRATFAFVNGLHGPILSSNLTCALALILCCVMLQLNQSEVLFFGYLTDYLVQIAVLMTGGFSILGYYLLRDREHGYLFAVFVRWMLWYGVGIIVLVVLRELLARIPIEGVTNPFATLPAMDCASTLHCSFQWYVLILPAIQGLLWGGLIFLTVVIVTLQWFNKRDMAGSGRTLFPYTCMAMTIMFMSTAVITWTVFLQFFEQIFVFDAIPATEGERLSKIALSASTPVWIALVCLISATVWVVLKRAKWKKNYAMDPVAAGPVPRLIVGKPLKTGLGLGMFAMCFGVLAMLPAIIDIFRFNFIDYDFCDLRPREAWHYFGLKALCYGPIISGLLATGVILIFPMIVGLMAVGLGVAKDIVSYFSFEPLRDENGKKDFKNTGPLLRKRINHRLFQVFRRLHASLKPDEVVIISHSQGTVVAIEALNDGLIDDLDFDQQKKVSLVTMGSPSSHIYSEYFRNRFNPNRTEILEQMKTKMARWVNIYRADDFVGTHINTRHANWPVNHEVNPGGHTGYWSDDEVRCALYKSVLTELWAECPCRIDPNGCCAYASVGQGGLYTTPQLG